MILSPETDAERIFALDACKGHSAVIEFDSGRFIAGKLAGHAPANGSRQWKIGGQVIGFRTINQIEVRP